MHLEPWHDPMIWSLNMSGEFPLLQLLTHMFPSLTVLITQKSSCHRSARLKYYTHQFYKLKETSLSAQGFGLGAAIVGWCQKGRWVGPGDSRAGWWRDLAEQKGHWDGSVGQDLAQRHWSGSHNHWGSPEGQGRSKVKPGSQAKTESFQAVLPHLHHTLLNTKPL